MENGSFYFTRRTVLLDSGCRLGGRVSIYEMAQEAAVEIDEPGDWHAVEQQLLRRQSPDFHSLLTRLRLLVVDVDGTLTDAGMYYAADGEMLKKFNTRDAKGLERIRAHGIEIVLLTTENSPIVPARARKLGIEYCYTGVADKLGFLREFCESRELPLEEVAYIGDDLNDLDCLQSVGFSACPADAVTAVRSRVRYISPCSGGSGAVRDICDLIIEFKR